MLILAWKQSPNELDLERPTQSQDAPEADQELVVDDALKENPILRFKTSMGDIKMELFLDKMPITAGNFLKLAESNFYDGVTFHRVIPGFMIQGGDPLSKDDNPDNDGTGGPGYFIEDEFHFDFTNEPGTISMANAGPNTGGSQFFINVANNNSLDSKHPVFGRVLEGMDIVEKIVNVERDARDRPIENVIIEEVLVE
ncbi:peptidylprolyl isomerase [Patescibacteria group bacterium]|nr:peptidylprolyl isomerase [Patescibacteria group bacterium]